MKFYVVVHPDGYTVQNKEGGCGDISITFECDGTYEKAQEVCDCANQVSEYYDKIINQMDPRISLLLERVSDYG